MGSSKVYNFKVKGSRRLSALRQNGRVGIQIEEIWPEKYLLTFGLCGLRLQACQISARTSIFLESMLWKGTGFLAGILSESAKE